ncbi:MAG: beta-lactamase family protein, partial [Gammaproteobacteria bacterium]|nr:beta-lactamase family protein [Gammaproteobacteria bacterium]
MSRFLRSMVILAAGLLPILVVGQGVVDRHDYNEMLNAARSVYDEEQLVGLQAAIYSRGTIRAELNLGYADVEHGVEVSSDTRFEVASINKTFTGLALLMLEERGLIDLEQPIQTLVPEFPEKPEGIVTPRFLAGALGGIRHYEENERTPAYYATHYE